MDELSQNIQNFNEEEIIVADASGFDPTAYEGKRVKIESMDILEVKDYYPDGELDLHSEETKTVVEIKTAPLNDMYLDEEGNVVDTGKLKEFPQEDGSVKNLRASHRFNLQQEIVNGKKQLRISKHPKASFWAFLMKVEATGDTLAEIRTKLIGKPVTLTTTPSKKQGEEKRRYLAIVVK